MSAEVEKLVSVADVLEALEKFPMIKNEFGEYALHNIPKIDRALENVKGLVAKQKQQLQRRHEKDKEHFTHCTCYQTVKELLGEAKR